MQHVLSILKSQHLEVTTAYFRQDNAGCYHCASTVLSCARAIDGERLFLVEEFLSPQQISSYFSRMAAKLRQQPVTDHDVLAVEEQVNFCLARDSVLSSLQICHPIVVDQYDICALVKSKAVKKLKVALLQVFCESLEFQVPSPQVRRKAPYVALLQKLVSSCSCSAITV